jgi:hypothetical protein
MTPLLVGPVSIGLGPGRQMQEMARRSAKPTWKKSFAGIRMGIMSKQKVAVDIDIRTLEGLLDDLRDLHSRLDRELRQLETSPRLSEPYLDHLSEIYTLMTWAKGLAPDLQTEMDRLTDQLPDD